MSAVFHLYNREARRKLKISVEGQTLPFCAQPTYLGIKLLDRAPKFLRHLESLRKKLTTHVWLLRRLAGSKLGASATMFRIATLALAHSTAEYCTFVWCRSAHTCLIDKPINNAFTQSDRMTVSSSNGQPLGCLCSTMSGLQMKNGMAE